MIRLSLQTAHSFTLNLTKVAADAVQVTRILLCRPLNWINPQKIINIKVKDIEDDNDGESYEKIFILFDNVKINETIDFYPNVGNGFYGQGVWVTVTHAPQTHQ